DHLARRPDAIDGKRAIEQRLGVVAGEILDRKAGDAGLDGAGDVDADLVRLMRKTVLEIGIDGNVHRRADRGQMVADVVDGDTVVGLADGPGKAGAGGSERLEAEMLQRLRRADINGVGYDEAAAFVQLSECGALVSSCQHGHSPNCLFAPPT